MKLPAPLSILWQATLGLSVRNGIEFSGYIAFTVMLALFPFIIFLVSLAGFFGQTRTGEEFIATLSLFAPPDVILTLRPAIDSVIKGRSSSLLTFGLLFALYSAASGVSALRLALNLSYGVTDSRSIWLRKLQDVVVVVVGSAVAILATVAIVLGPLIWDLISWFAFVNADDRRLWHLGRYGFTLLIMTASVIALHRVLPGRPLTLREILPGAFATTMLWTVAASALTLYFDRFSNYASTYGSLGGVIITLLFFYVSAIIFVFGGELNAALMAHRKERAHIHDLEARPSPAPI